MLVWDGMGRESLTQVQGTIENMTWESVNSLFSEHRTPWGGSPEHIGLPLLSDRGCSLSGSFFLSSQWTHKGIPGFLKRKIKILCLLSGQWLMVISANSKVGRNRNFHERKQLHLQIGAKVGWSGHLSSFMRGWLTEKTPQSLQMLNWWIASVKICQSFFSYVFMIFICLGIHLLKWYIIFQHKYAHFISNHYQEVLQICWPNSRNRAWTGPSLIFIQSKCIEGKLFLSNPHREGVSKGATRQHYYPLQFVWWLLRSKVISIMQHSCSLLVTLCHYICFENETVFFYHLEEHDKGAQAVFWVCVCRGHQSETI